VLLGGECVVVEDADGAEREVWNGITYVGLISENSATHTVREGTSV